MVNIHSSQYRGEGACVKSDGLSKVSALYETRGNWSEAGTPTASLFLINDGATGEMFRSCADDREGRDTH